MTGYMYNDTIYYSTVLNDGAILTYLKRKGIVSPNKPTTYNPGLRDISVKKAKFDALYLNLWVTAYFD